VRHDFLALDNWPAKTPQCHTCRPETPRGPCHPLRRQPLSVRSFAFSPGHRIEVSPAGDSPQQRTKRVVAYRSSSSPQFRKATHCAFVFLRLTKKIPMARRRLLKTLNRRLLKKFSEKDE